MLVQKQHGLAVVFLRTQSFREHCYRPAGSCKTERKREQAELCIRSVASGKVLCEDQ